MTQIRLATEIEGRILQLRDKKIILDRDLALLYGVKPIALRQQVKRNRERFPDDFMFQINKSEADYLVSQKVIPSSKHLGGYLPYAFTQEGVAMLSSVLRSRQAVLVNIQIMRAFVKLRQLISPRKELASKLETLENRIGRHDDAIQEIFRAIRQLMAPPRRPRRKIGFYT